MCPFFFNQETVAQFALKILHSFKKYILIFLDVRERKRRRRKVALKSKNKSQMNFARMPHSRHLQQFCGT